jgi:hypothetical protein
MNHRIVVVFPGSSKAFLATVIGESKRQVTVMTPAEEVLKVWPDQVRNARPDEVREGIRG